jgi:hypothetical protein
MNEEILEDLTCLEGLMKMKRKLVLGLKPGTLEFPSRLQSPTACRPQQQINITSVT